jgi:hypothetical protein
MLPEADAFYGVRRRFVSPPCPRCLDRMQIPLILQAPEDPKSVDVYGASGVGDLPFLGLT